jgi:FtsP/CotA-like multicopper oxidase with cupredoxin domain
MRPERFDGRAAMTTTSARIHVLAAGVLLGVTPVLWHPSARAQTTMVCTDGPTFELVTAAGHIQTPDGNSVFMWSYADGSSGGAFQVPSPVLCVNEGDLVTVTLTNTLAEPVSIVFPGQSGVTSTGGAAGLFGGEAPACSGGAPPACVPGTVSYSFVAEEPGTYLYESGANPHKQVQMGLYGALVVRPAIGADFAYNDPTTRFDAAREYLILIHDLDPLLHRAVERGLPYDVTAMHDRYWHINGRSFPDTIADNFAPWLPEQPYGSLVRIEAFDAATNPLPALVRYANAGMVNHPFHPHGNHLRIIARDGRRLVSAGVDISGETFTTIVGSGQTFDLLARWVNTEGWTSTGNPIPVQVPGLQNLVFKDDLSFYSGSPYLGEQGDLPVVVSALNECGELYFPWHSHALNEFQNFDEGFGGLATLWRIDPPGGCP